MSNLFEDKSVMPESPTFPMREMDTAGAPLVVRTTMVPSEAHDRAKMRTLINHTVREPMSVEHVARPRYGHVV
jgi:hypothetical protein